MLFPTLTNLLNEGARLNRNDPLRNGNMLCFPGVGDLVVAGDLHNHARNFSRIQSFANLEENPDRHVILQEIVHGGPIDGNGSDRSLDMLLDAIAWAEKFPGRVHFLLANHDLAQLQGLAIMKDGYDLTERFSRYFHARAGSSREAATEALSSFILTMPLAAITLTGIFLSHSLPGPRELATFDSSVLRRELTEADFSRTGSVYSLIWGRGQNQETLNMLSKAWWSDIFVCGHQAQDQGYGIIGDRMLVIDSSHNHGMVLRFGLDKQYTMQDLVDFLRPLASIA
jgi:Calcineurin-like phosphoesterase